MFPEDHFSLNKRGKISGLRKPVLRNSTLHGLEIMRLEEFPDPVFVSEKFRDVYESNELTGYSFSDVALSQS